MAYVVSSLPDYTEQPEKVIYDKVFTGSPVLEAIKSNGNLMTGVKSSQTINLVDTEGVWQDQSCGLNPSGSTTITQRIVTVGKPKIDLEFCERNLESKFTQKALPKGGNYDSITFHSEIVEDALGKIAKRMATAVWQGDTASWNAYLNKFDGLIKILDADIPVANVYSGVVWSEANSRSVFKGLAALVIADQDVYKAGNTTAKAYCSPAMRAQYAWKLITDNLYHIDPKDNTQKLYIEGTTIEVIGDPGLAGITKVYVIEDENFHGATDMENEEEKIDVWYSKDDKKIYLSTEWKFGINLAFASRCYSYPGV